MKIRPADLYVTHGLSQPGVVLVGDAFATSCPAAGTGTGKVFTDVERLCNVHIPRWLATDGMGAEKIAAFYDDPVKRACDRHSFDKAFTLRSVSIDEGLPGAPAAGAASSAALAIGTARRARSAAAGHSEPASCIVPAPQPCRPRSFPSIAPTRFTRRNAAACAAAIC